MGQEYTAKSFKSGNSVAIRVPAGLGIAPDREWAAEWVDGELRLRAKDQPKRKFNVAKVWGSARGLDIPYIKDEDRIFEERPLLWDDPAVVAKSSE